MSEQKVIVIRRQEIILPHSGKLPENIRLDGKRYVENGIGEFDVEPECIVEVYNYYEAIVDSPFWEIWDFTHG